MNSAADADVHCDNVGASPLTINSKAEMEQMKTKLWETIHIKDRLNHVTFRCLFVDKKTHNNAVLIVPIVQVTSTEYN